MSQFIKLSHMVINTSKIITIESHLDKHYISMINNKTNGYLFGAFGFVNTCPNDIIICKNKNPIDYKTIQEWIDQN